MSRVRSKRGLQLSIVAVAAIGLTACVTRSEIEEIKSNQKEILAKLEKMEKAGPGRAQPPRPRGPDPEAVYAFPVGDSPAKGGDEAWVTVVEVSDFQCPFCQRVGGTIAELEKKYGDDLRVVFKHNALPFHNRAEPAALAAECAREQGKFWPMHDKLFENQRALEDADLEKYAQEIGVDVGKWKTCHTGDKYKQRLKDDQATAAKMGARGTPAFFINGRFLSGAQPAAAFEAIIDDELKKAKASGLAKREYYAKAVEAKGKSAL